MAEETLTQEKTFQELLVRADPRGGSPAKDGTGAPAAIRIVSPKPKAPAPTPAAVPAGRDWASAIELINEAAEAVRLADERAIAAERYSQELAQYYTEQAKAAELKIAGLEKRLEVTEAKARDAEEWLVRFHDAIMSGFGNLLKKAG
ncbi:MAG TPA: hypothetical protein VL492_11360 [Methylovirgula sp.]|jgi:predicted DNA-binding protein (UPF0251 family)|nr:hypothetical protein [Methylovirgula sp.]